MKIRTGFVSNSSSSSFIVYRANKFDEKYERNFKAYIRRFIEDDGVFLYDPKTEFGWQFEVHRDWLSKFDWAILQMYYHMYDPQFTYYYESMLFFLQQYFPEIRKIKIRSEYADEEEYDDEPTGYIDHQSIGGENAEILEDIDTLRNWLFCDDSFVCNQNDNSNVRWKIVDGEPVKSDYSDMWQ